jgi:mRNA interferase MazF
VVKRGQVWWAELDEPAGSGPGYRRLVVIVQADEFNKSRIQTVLAVVITSNLHLANAPGNVLLPAKASGLSRRSVANVSQVITLDKDFLSEQIGKLDRPLMNQINDGLKLALAL